MLFDLRIVSGPFFILIIIFLSACSHNDHLKYQGTLPEKVDFNYHVKPILSDRCFACHGPDKNALKAALRLDIPEGALKKVLESGGHAFVPGKTNRSEAFKRIISDDPELQMPPPEAGLALTEYEIAMIARWIDQGAEYKPHWAFIPAQTPTIPEVKDKRWVQNPIDNFILKNLENSGLSPNREASKETLLRRVTLDLTGLPPTIEEIDNFISDSSNEAYEKVVDRLLASPHYGERMALEWLDVARYADSHGYSTDGYRMMWPWRDWVINAFNKNMPMDRFITWQIAGDKIPNATKEQRLATAFLRNQKLNAEGGIIQEEYLVEYAADRTETTATAFLGLTMQCARCHDHKYDPISQEEYYQLFGFFNSVNERGLVQNDGNSGPQILLTTEEVEERIAFIDSKIKEQKLKLAQSIRVADTLKYPEPELDLAKGLLVDLSFEKITGNKVRNNTDTKELYDVKGDVIQVAGKNGKAVKFEGYSTVNITNKQLDFERSDAFSFSFWINSHHANDYMPLLFHLAGKNEGYRGYEIAVINGYPTLRLINKLPANLIAVRTENQLIKDKWKHFTFVYDGSGSANGVEIFVNGKRDKSHVVFDQLTQTISINRNFVAIGGRQDYQVDVKGYGLIDDLKIYKRMLSEVEAQAIYNGSSIDPAKISTKSLKNHYLLNTNKEYKKIQQKLKLLREKKNQILDTVPTVMVMHDLPEARPAFLLERGAYDAPQQQVQPGTPKTIFPFPEDFPVDRLGLAKWLVDKRNPLTGRVIVNRYWQIYFGRGIVKTTEDFGNQGALPSHPDLLDYLTTTFVESGWNTKTLQKLIVMSATYRQSSRSSEEQRKADPENGLLARGPSHRLQAELIRDCALAASGLLVNKIGGPSSKPYQPKGLWQEKSSFSKILKSYKEDEGDQLYRRGLYTFWRRTSPPPSMITFDAPTRDYCIVRRQKTNTPLQALVLLNDPQFFEAARVLAERVTSQGAGVNNQVILAHRLLTGLTPKPEVLKLLNEHYHEQKKQFEQNPELADQLLTVGRFPVNNKLSPVEVAAMSVVCNTIMSFDETIVKR
ncbi:DUF1553 domain-containing protein [Fulvivirgaceae bacterium BMA12]|uniref:DUF1553 domain-containing protein n=1 Tax=Agaribacillus aureus TaxID=3051825 RepID=A0ABT8L9R7_9BACT|nr:DUF1553 domain-containing protein [Fulvivirgaceae bacterium BMA12]